MTEKVKVSREVATILDRTISNFGGDKAFIVANYVRGGCGGFWREDFNVMRELSDDKLFKALYVGYEIEETPEEQILRKYKENYETASTTPVVKDQWRANGFNSGIRFVLNRLEIEIKGINK